MTTDDVLRGQPPLFDIPLDAAAGEHSVPHEEEAIRATTDILLRIVGKAYGGTDVKALRDVHAISHGCVRGTITIPVLPSDLRQGMFAEQGSFDTIVRFSNGDGVGAGGAPEDDIKSMMRGMAIKVLGVPGRKLLKAQEGATTQDFLLVNRPEFFLRNIVDYVGAMKFAEGSIPRIGGFLAKHPAAAARLVLSGLSLRFDRNQIDNPLNTTYFSKLPYRYGSLVVKYRARPCDPVPVVVPSNPPARYLRAAMKAQLDAAGGDQREGACFAFEIQRHRDEDIEDATLRWSAPFEEIARITIPKQEFDTQEQNDACESLSFTPWHSLPAHRPLGSLNRGRKVVYELLSRFRHDHNGVRQHEP